MNSTPGAGVGTATTGSRQEAIFVQHSLWGKKPGGVGTGKEGEKRPFDHNRVSTITVTKIKSPRELDRRQQCHI